MAFLIWKDVYSVNNNKLDEQHKKLINLINELYDLFLKNDNNINKKEILLNLKNYTKEHFRQEEYFLKKYNYSEIESHIKEHEIFINTITELENGDFSEKAFLIKTTTFLQKWIINHILEKDKKYSTIFP